MKFSGKAAASCLQCFDNWWLGGRKGIRPVKNMGMVEVGPVSPDGMAPSRIVSVSASVSLPLHH